MDTARVNGQLYFGTSEQSSGYIAYWLRGERGRVYILSPDSTDILLFDFDADVGESWELPGYYNCSFGVRIVLVSREDTVVTPTGTF